MFRWLSLLFLLSSCQVPAYARPADKWAQASPERQEFFKKAMRPDLVSKEGKLESPCCGEADAYEADDFETEEGNLYAILTCSEEDENGVCPEVQGRTYRAPGTRILIPPEKILPPHTPTNRTGHGWVFMSGSGNYVFCYALPGGS